MLEHVPIPLLKAVFPIEEPDLARDRPLQVLCLGLGRTGTDSLRNALYELGYNDVHHGFRSASSGVGEAVQWYRLALAKFKDNNEGFLTRAQFDKVIGDCEATTDLPSAAFGIELLRAYPEAKVILNQRKDVESWYQSQQKTIDLLYRTWPDWTRQWFESESFWLGRLVTWTVQKLSNGNFKRNGMELYKNHYAALEAECEKQGRPFLRWTVEDSWEPLCNFLNKEVPEKGFPNENNQGNFAQRRAQVHHKRFVRARRNMVFTGVILSGAIAVGLAWYMA